MLKTSYALAIVVLSVKLAIFGDFQVSSIPVAIGAIAFGRMML